MVIYFGWNASTSNNIEAHMVMGHINNLRAFIPSEDIEYLNSIPKFEISISDEEIKRTALKDLEPIKHTNITKKTSSDKYFSKNH